MLSDAAAILSKKQLVLRGNVIFYNTSRSAIGTVANVTVQLQDTSIADAPAIFIAQDTHIAALFPIPFAIKYCPTQVANGIFFSLTATIRDRTNKLLYINNIYIPVIPLGDTRTTNINVPVIHV